MLEELENRAVNFYKNYDESIDEYRSNIKERLACIETILNRELPDIKEQLKLANGRKISKKR